MGKVDLRLSDDEIREVLQEMIADQLPLKPVFFMAYVYGPPEEWPDDWDPVLPGVMKTVSPEDQVGPVQGAC